MDNHINKNESHFCQQFRVFIVLGMSASIILLALAVLLPLLYRKFMEKTSKGAELPHYPDLEDDVLSQVVIVNENTSYTCSSSRMPPMERKMGLYCGDLDMDNQPRKRSLEKKQQKS